jgi:hypothetical protein
MRLQEEATDVTVAHIADAIPLGVSSSHPRTLTN